MTRASGRFLPRIRYATSHECRYHTPPSINHRSRHTHMPVSYTLAGENGLNGRERLVGRMAKMGQQIKQNVNNCVRGNRPPLPSQAMAEVMSYFRAVSNALRGDVTGSHAAACRAYRA